jgi:hypothetical protein
LGGGSPRRFSNENLKGDIADRVHGESSGNPDFRDHDARQHRTDEPREVEDDRTDSQRRDRRLAVEGARNKTGRKSASEINPSKAPEWVKIQASQPTAPLSSHQPINEILLPPT